MQHESELDQPIRIKQQHSLQMHPVNDYHSMHFDVWINPQFEIVTSTRFLRRQAF
ncbi:MAG: hypothetical protein KME63_00795 [Candidatus Thiodiazotropha sp. (ex Clathrolucina costata)]|nr:hypothetical protein [Candidatus Thiodiazotropha taylori]